MRSPRQLGHAYSLSLLCSSSSSSLPRPSHRACTQNLQESHSTISFSPLPCTTLQTGQYFFDLKRVSQLLHMR